MAAINSSDFPLRVDEVLYAAVQEWRREDVLPLRTVEAWQLVYVVSGTVEELCDKQWILLRQGGILLHQPLEAHSMRVSGTIPPEILRIEFICTAPAMDVFRGKVFHADPMEQADLKVLCRTVTVSFDAPEKPGNFPTLREDVPFGTAQRMCNFLEDLLILLARRVQRPRKPGYRVRLDQQATAVVDAAVRYFAEHLSDDVTQEAVCEAVGCSRLQLQKAFRLKLRHTPMEELAQMRLDFAAQLLARGEPPGEVAKRLNYCSGAYFSRCFKEATGHTPSEYRRIQQGLSAKRIPRRITESEEKYNKNL